MAPLPEPYHLYAFEQVQDDSWEDPDLLREIDGKGVALRLEEGAAESVEVPMIRHSELGALLARIGME
jgi:hypothetical protein